MNIQPSFFLFVGMLMAGIPGCNLEEASADQTRTRIQVLAEKDLHKKQGASFDITGKALPDNRYFVDTTHSSVQFRTRHWGIYDIIGWFERYEMVVYYDKSDFSDMVVEARLKPASIIMPNHEMAGHLKEVDFFDVASFPVIFFKSTSLRPTANNRFSLLGELTIKDITKKVTFDVRLNGYAHPPSQMTPGFTLEGKINRLDFQLGGEDLLPGNKLSIIGNEVYITSNVRLISGYD